MPESIREIIKKKSEELRFVDQLGPAKASEELVALSSLLASLGSYIVEKHYWFNMKKVQLLEEHKTAAKANIYSAATTEWKDLQEAVVQQSALMELIRSVKYYLKAADSERRETRY